MSTICIGVIKNVFCNDRNSLRIVIDRFVKNSGYGVFFNGIYEEPFFEAFGNNDFVFSLADDYDYNNCEMLMLRDGDFYNGSCTTQSFSSKMYFIKNLFLMLKGFGYPTELFIGQSGESLEDYTQSIINLDDFVSYMETTDDFKSYHLVIE